MIEIHFKGKQVIMKPTGYLGTACQQVSAHYTKDMGLDMKKAVPTEEMYAGPQAQAVQNPEMA